MDCQATANRKLTLYATTGLHDGDGCRQRWWRHQLQTSVLVLARFAGDVGLDLFGDGVNPVSGGVVVWWCGGGGVAVVPPRGSGDGPVLADAARRRRW